jgi:hypothetical protein
MGHLCAMTKKPVRPKSRFKKFLFFALLFLGLSFAVIVNPTFERTHAQDSISPNTDRLRGWVIELASSPHRSVDNWARLEAVAKWLDQQLKMQGWEVRHQSYSVPAHQAVNLSVLYVPEGVSPDAPRLIVGAHYDVCFDLPGADDNASGVAGLLELTHWVMQKKPKLKQPVEFVLWALEEPPFYDTDMMGSYVHAKSLKEKNISVKLAVSLEMIGYRSREKGSQRFPVDQLKYIYPDTGDFITLISNAENWTLTRKSKIAMQSYSAIPVYSMNAHSAIEGIDWSDHRSYWKFGFPAVMITDTSFYRNPNYHGAGDLPETLDYDFMAEVIRGVWGIMHEL